MNSYILSILINVILSAPMDDYKFTLHNGKEIVFVHLDSIESKVHLETFLWKQIHEQEEYKLYSNERHEVLVLWTMEFHDSFKFNNRTDFDLFIETMVFLRSNKGKTIHLFQTLGKEEIKDVMREGSKRITELCRANNYNIYSLSNDQIYLEDAYQRHGELHRNLESYLDVMGGVFKDNVALEYIKKYKKN